MKRAIISVVVMLSLLGTVVPLTRPVQADFTQPPTFDVATNNNVAGATDTVYTFTLGELDEAGDFIKEVIIRVPDGYKANQSLLNPGQLLGTVNVDGFLLEIRVDVGARAVVYWLLGPFQVPVGEVILDWGARELILRLSFDYTATLVEAVLSTVDGLLINPDTPGTYNWRAWAKARNSDFWELTPQDIVIIPQALHVQSIDLSYSQRWLFTWVRGEVTIVDASGKPAAGASVRYLWGGIFSSIRFATTDSSGKARMSLWLWNRHGLLTLTVLNVTKPGEVYNPAANVETTDGIIIP